MNKIFKIVEDILKTVTDEYKTEAKLLIEEISGLSREDLILAGSILNEDKIIELAHYRAQTKEPLQHILGCCYFMGDKYIVNKNVLIPRDETELLVNKAFELVQDKKEKIDILDIGIGSGCISCALAKKLQNTEILGVDISIEALQIAIENISKLDLIRRVVVRKSDIYSKIRDSEKFDLIISNPPYIPKKEKNNLQKEVLFEPEIALFAPDTEGVEFYQRIIFDSLKFLKKDGALAFELGIGQAKAVAKLLDKDFYNIEITKDLAGIERVITARKK